MTVSTRVVTLVSAGSGEAKRPERSKQLIYQNTLTPSASTAPKSRSP